MVGSAVATMVWSSAPRNIASMMPSTMARTSGCVSGRGSGFAGACDLDFLGLATMGAFDAARAAPWQWLATRGCYDPAMRTFRSCITFLALLSLTPPAAAVERLPEGLVYLRDVDASIAQDMRYAGFDNFTGHPLPGYDAPECVLRRAVRAFMRWAQEPDKVGAREAPTKRFFPTLEKRTLFASGYIAAHSAHSN